VNWQINKRVLARLATGLLLFVLSVTTAWAWYPISPYANPYYTYPGYYPGYPTYWQDIRGPRFYGYAQPRWYMRGRMNRYGDFRFDVKLRDFSMADLYYAWWMFNNSGY
jgi:hypothetical protein